MVMTLQFAHPDVELLARYNRGDLEPEQFSEVEAHILACDSCCDKLQELPGDSFIEQLQSLHEPKPSQYRGGSIDPHQKTVRITDDAEASTSHSEPNQPTEGDFVLRSDVAADLPEKGK